MTLRPLTSSTRTTRALDIRAGMTAAEIRAALAGVPGDAAVRVRTGFRGQLTSLTVSHREPARDPEDPAATLD